MTINHGSGSSKRRKSSIKMSAGTLIWMIISFLALIGLFFQSAIYQFLGLETGFLRALVNLFLWGFGTFGSFVSVIVLLAMWQVYKLKMVTDVKTMEDNGDIERLLKATHYRATIGSNADAITTQKKEFEATKVRIEAMKALARIGSARAVEPLVNIMLKKGVDGKDDLKYIDDRRAAREALASIRDAEAIDQLIKGIKMEDADVRWAAGNALGNIGDVKAVKPLLAVLYKQYPNGKILNKDVVKALGMIKGTTEAVEPLIEALPDPTCFTINKEVMEALAEIGDQRAIKPLVNIFKNTKGLYDREVVADALSKLNWQPERDEFGAIYYIIKKDWDKCALIGAPAVELLISDTAKWKATSSRIEAVKALGKIGDERAIEPLLKIVKEEFESLFDASDGEVYAAGAAEDQEHKRQFDQLLWHAKYVLKSFAEKEGLDPIIKESITQALR